MKTIDCKGLSCLAPILNTKEAIENEDLGELCVMVDNGASKENVSRFLSSQGYDVIVYKEGTNFNIIGKRKQSIYQKFHLKEVIRPRKGSLW